MTILEAGAKLYNWFAENDSFNFDEDFQKVILVTDHPNRDRAAFLGAIKDFESIELVEPHEIDSKTYWVLKKPFSSFPQNVSISPTLALAISDIINKFCEISDTKEEMCDPMNISESDIRKIILLSNLLTGNKDVDTDGEL